MATDSAWQLSSDVPHFSFQGDIEGLIYTFKLLFNERDGFWYLSIFDEAGQSAYPHGRRVIATGAWLTVDEADQITVEQFRRLYDLSAGRFFPGALLAISSQPLQGVQADADVIQLQYFSATALVASLTG